MKLTKANKRKVERVFALLDHRDCECVEPFLSATPPCALCVDAGCDSSCDSRHPVCYLTGEIRVWILDMEKCFGGQILTRARNLVPKPHR